MKMPLKYTAAAFAAIAAGIGAYAQDITTEVVVERSIQPVERAATRPSGMTPVLLLPPVGTVTLSTASYTGLSPVVRAYTSLQPARGADVPTEGPWRGYVSLGYFPVYNLGFAAGYRVISDARSTLDVHASFNGFDYKAWDDADEKNKYNGGTIGADYSLQPNGYSRLTASADYTYASAATYYTTSQSRNAGHINVGWESELQGLEYSAAIKADIDAFGDTRLDLGTVNTPYNGLHQQLYGIDLGAALPFGEDNKIGVDLSATFMHSTSDTRFAYSSSATLGIAHIRPYYSLQSGDVSASAGLNVDFFTGGTGSKVHVSPAIDLAWTPAQILALHVTATAGTGFNSVRSMLDQCPLLPAFGSFGRYRVPYDISGAIIVGPAAGFTATLSGGYSHAKNVLMPGLAMLSQPMGERDAKGWHGCLELGYEQRLFSVGASAEIASSDAASGKGYYLWTDGARWQIKAHGTVRPVERLAVGIDYTFRSHRHTPTTSLGCISDLALRATYRFTDRLDVFANVENLLGRRYLIVPTVSSQKLHGLVGATFRF